MTINSYANDEIKDWEVEVCMTPKDDLGPIKPGVKGMCMEVYDAECMLPQYRPSLQGGRLKSTSLLWQGPDAVQAPSKGAVASLDTHGAGSSLVMRSCV